MPNNELTDAQAFLLLAILHAVHAVGIWGVLKKAGRNPRNAVVPILNFVELCRVAKLSPWWLLAIFVPGLNFVMSVLLGIRLTQRFGWSSFFGVVMGLSGFLLLPILGFSPASFQQDDEEPASESESVTNAERSLQENRIHKQVHERKPLLIAFSIFYGLCILGAPGLLVIGAMAFDAPGSQNSIALWIAVGSVLTAPLTMLFSVILSWILFSRSKVQSATVVIFLPALHVVGLIAGILWGVIESQSR